VTSPREEDYALLVASEINRVGETEILPTIEMRASSDTIACSLHHDALTQRVEEWRSLLTHVTARVPIPNGIRLEFPPDVPVSEISSLASAEQECCNFFSFSIASGSEATLLDVRAPSHARDLVTALFGEA
jgi:hypothetical protein